MKRFIFSVLAVSIFFVGLSSLIEKAGARFKSDERALALMRQARQALGGDSAINSVQSLRIVGQTTRTFNINGTSRTETGETEIALQLPDKVMRTMKIGHGDDGIPGDKMVQKQIDLVLVNNGEGGKEISVTADGDQPGNGVKKILIKRPDGTVQELTGADAEKVIVSDGIARRTSPDGDGGERHIVIKKSDREDRETRKHNELLRLTLGLLLSAPQGLDVDYNYGGDADVDGTPCSIVVAQTAGSSFKIYLNRTSYLPVMMVYTGVRMPNIMFFKKDAAAGTDSGDKMVFMRSADGPAPETAEFQVKFSDYRSVNGVQLPFKWTQTVAGAADEIFDVMSFEVNPANIAERFETPKGMVRTTRPE